MAVYKRARRMIRKGVRKAGQYAGKAIKSRYYPNKKLNVGQIVRDVAMVKKLMNVEKKRWILSASNQPVGQVLGNLSGYYQTDLTPFCTSGVGYNQRTGSSLKVVSYHMQMQFISQSAAVGRTNFKILIMETLAGSFNPVAAYLDNTFVSGSIVDYNSQINPDQYGRYKIIQSKRVSIEPDSSTGQVAYRTASMGKKHQVHIRFQLDTATVTNKRIYMLILADSGNASTTTASTLTGIPQTAINTGATVSYNWTAYYVDN